MSADVSRAGRGLSRTKSRVVAVAIILVLAIAAGFGLRWWTHPDAFGNLGDRFGTLPRPVDRAALSTTFVYPKTKGDPETVTINSARAVFGKNTARATASFWICDREADEVPIGSVHDAEGTCSDIAPLEPGTVYLHSPAPDGDYLFVTIAPTRPGVARLLKVELEYERGARYLFQRGTETIHADRTVTAR